jgi:hypothetical protein
MRQIPKLEELIAKGHMKKMTGRGPKNRDIDQALYEWYCVRKAAGERPKSCQVSSDFIPPKLAVTFLVGRRGEAQFMPVET